MLNILQINELSLLHVSKQRTVLWKMCWGFYLFIHSFNRLFKQPLLSRNHFKELKGAEYITGDKMPHHEGQFPSIFLLGKPIFSQTVSW